MNGDGSANDSLRILIALMYAYPGPSACSNHVHRLARGLLSAGHLPLIIAPQGPAGAAKGVDDSGVTFQAFAMPAKPRFVPYYPHWIRSMRTRMHDTVNCELRQRKYDAVIVMGESAWIFNPVRKRAQELGLSVFGYPIEWIAPTAAGLLGLSWFDQWLHRVQTYPKCNGIIGISRQWARFAEAKRIPSRVVPSFSKYADDALPNVMSHAPGRFRIVFVGRWHRRELPTTLFRGLDMAIDRGVDLELIVLGSTGKPTCTSQAIEERPAQRALEKYPRVRERIKFMGFVTPEALIDEMGQADAFVILRDDNLETRSLFPTRLPEFLSAGKPLIVSDAGDLAFYLKNRESACVIPPGDHPKELADAICFLATNPEEAGQIGLGGRAALAHHFSQSVLARRIADFINEVRGRNQATH